MARVKGFSLLPKGRFLGSPPRGRHVIKGPLGPGGFGASIPLGPPGLGPLGEPRGETYFPPPLAVKGGLGSPLRGPGPCPRGGGKKIGGPRDPGAQGAFRKRGAGAFPPGPLGAGEKGPGAGNPPGGGRKPLPRRPLGGGPLRPRSPADGPPQIFRNGGGPPLFPRESPGLGGVKVPQTRRGGPPIKMGVPLAGGVFKRLSIVGGPFSPFWGGNPADSPLPSLPPFPL